MLAPVVAALAVLGGPWVSVNPGVVTLGHTASVTVVGVRASRLEVHLVGASVAFGHPAPWTRMHRVGGTWQGMLPVPEFRGIYPVELRIRSGAPVISSRHWFLRVFAHGTMSRPSFATPEEVASWWVRTMPPKATLTALKRWPAPTFDRRDRRLHQLMVIAYDVLKPWPPVAPRPGRVGIFVMAVRDGFHGRWRFLEATTSP
jgi:hypothetical protein